MCSPSSRKCTPKTVREMSDRALQHHIDRYHRLERDNDNLRAEVKRLRIDVPPLFGSTFAGEAPGWMRT